MNNEKNYRPYDDGQIKMNCSQTESGRHCFHFREDGSAGHYHTDRCCYCQKTPKEIGFNY